MNMLGAPKYTVNNGLGITVVVVDRLERWAH
jgi:hypothetical protein